MLKKLDIHLLKRTSTLTHLRQSDFTTPRYNSVTYGRHSLRHLGPKLWAKLSSDDRSAKTLNEFKRRIRGKDLAELIESGCKGCILLILYCILYNSVCILYNSVCILY